MYKQIFKKGVNDKSIKLAGEYAKEVVKAFVTTNIVYTLIIKESFKIIPIVKVPTAEIHTIRKDGSVDIEYYPTKKSSYDSVKFPVDFLNDEIGNWLNPPSFKAGIDPYDVNDKESKGSLFMAKNWGSAINEQCKNINKKK